MAILLEIQDLTIHFCDSRDPRPAVRQLNFETAMNFQEPMSAVNPVMPVGLQVAEALEVQEPSLSRREVNQRAVEAFTAVALPEPERRYNDCPHQFGGEQRQRILVAMALTHKPKLLIADEPTTLTGRRGLPLAMLDTRANTSSGRMQEIEADHWVGR